MQAPAIRIAKDKGWKVICADGNPGAPSAPYADEFLHIDLKDKVGLEEAARKIQEEEGLNGVFTAGTDFSASVAWVAEKLGLPGISYDTALNATDKIRMRTCFREAGVPSPSFIELSEDMDFSQAVRDMTFPLVVKPVDNMGARGVRKINDLTELAPAVQEAINYSRTDRAIVEEFLAGEEYSIDALVYKGKVTIHGLAIRHIYFPPCFIEMGHTMPAQISPEKEKEIVDVFTRGVQALGIDMGAAKGDIFYTSQGPVIGEIAARLSGGYMSGWTFPQASFVESTEGAMNIAMGLEPAPYEGKYEKVSAERAFLSIPGTVKSIRNVEEAYAMDNVNDLFLRVEEGDKVDFPVNNVEKCGNIISSHKERAVAVKASEQACAKILITLDENDTRTGDFLFSEREWPSDAFSLNNSYTSAAYDEMLESVDFDWMEENFHQFAPVPLPDLEYETSLDWQGRKLNEVYREVLELTGMEESDTVVDPKAQAFFWRSIIKGSIQGALWFCDRFCRDR